MQKDDHVTEQPIEQNLSTPSRVQKDMEFLKNSWANIADNEEAEARLLAALEKEPAVTNTQPIDNEGFHIHMSKNQKKAQNKQIRNEAYPTRSKVSKPPFK